MYIFWFIFILPFVCVKSMQVVNVLTEAVPADDKGIARLVMNAERELNKKIYIFFLQKRMESLQEAFIHAPELCEAYFTTD